jgi:hypothetical protein
MRYLYGYKTKKALFRRYLTPSRVPGIESTIRNEKGPVLTGFPGICLCFNRFIYCFLQNLRYSLRLALS